MRELASWTGVGTSLSHIRLAAGCCTHTWGHIGSSAKLLRKKYQLLSQVFEIYCTIHLSCNRGGKGSPINQNAQYSCQVVLNNV